MPRPAPVPAPAVETTGDLDILLTIWQLELEAANLSPATQHIYALSVRYFSAFLADQGMPRMVAAISGEHLREWLRALQAAGRAAATNSTYYRCVHLFFAWLVERCEIPVSPCVRIKAPILPRHASAIYSPADVTRLLATCSGNTFTARRDTALLSLLIDTGMRRAECAGIQVGDVVLVDSRGRRSDDPRVTVHGKGRKDRTIGVGLAAHKALLLYEVARRTHPHAGEAAYWLGRVGALHSVGLYDMIRRRATAAAVPAFAPHDCRRFAARTRIRLGAGDAEMRAAFGWTTSDMINVYVQEAAQEQARAAHPAHSPLDHVARQPRGK